MLKYLHCGGWCSIIAGTNNINTYNMNTLLNANEARLQKCLLQRLRLNNEVLTIKDAINSGKFVSAQSREVPKVKWNRSKFNNMSSWQEQQEYEKKLQEKKTVYELHMPDGCFYEIPKMVYDYYNSLNK